MDPAVSATSARLRRVGLAGYEIVDEGALNPIRVNGARLRDPVALVQNDVVRIGDTLLVVDLADPARSARPSGDRAALLEALCMLESTARGVLELETRFFDPDSRCAAVRGDGFSEIRLMADWLASTWGAVLVRVDATDPAVLDRLADSTPGQLVFVERVDVLEPRHMVGLARAIEARCTDHAEHPVAFSYRSALPGSLVEGLVQLSSDATFNVPALSERRADVLPGVRRLVGELGGPTDFVLPAVCAEKLLCYEWPGGLSELRRTARRLFMQLTESGEVTPLALPAEIRAVALDPDATRSHALTQESFEALFREYAGNMSDIAEHLGYARTYMYRLLRARGINLDAVRRRFESGT